MTTQLKLATLALLLSIVSPELSNAHAQGTAFTYQGRLNEGGSAANGSYDLAFTLFATNTDGSAIAGPVTNSAVFVSNGLFTALVDFGDAFTGTSNWLEIAVSTNGADSFSTLTPRQQLTPVPYAITAERLASPLDANSLPANVVTNNAAGLTLSGAFAGDGSGLSSVNAYSVNGLTTDSLWKVGGNAGANPTNGAFLGTTDNLPLEFKVNGLRALRLEYASDINLNNAASANIIGGCSGNIISNGICGAVIAGGGDVQHPQQVGASYAAVLGGRGNVASGPVSTAMGDQTKASAVGSTSMGFATTASGPDATAMGVGTHAIGQVSTAIAVFTTASDDNSTAMGYQSTASGWSSTAMGTGSMASGSNSVAMGNLARASGYGSFVWNSFPAASLPENDFQVGVYGAHGLNVDYYTQRADGGGSRWFYVGDNIAGDTIHAWNGAHLTDGGVWANASDKNRKTDFATVNPKDVLNKLLALPVTEWRYTNEVSSIRHLGPMAQDFKSVFQLGNDDKSIGTVDESGVALAAIQGLNQKLTDELRHRDSENAELKQRLDALEKIVRNQKSNQEGTQP